MNCLILALSFLASPAAVDGDVPCLPTRMSLDEEPRGRQDVEQDRQRPEESSERLTPMEFFFRHSQLEMGAIYTDFDSSLALKSHMGYYLRYGVELAPRISVHLTYRYNEWSNDPASSPVREDLRVQTLLFGASYTQPLMRDFAVVGGVGIGPTWWDSSLAPGDIGVTVSAELGVTARLYELLRFKMGLVVDGANTNFHAASGMQINLGWLFGLEIGL